MPQQRFEELPAERQAAIRQNLTTLQQKGASDGEIESYLRDDEGLAPSDGQEHVGHGLGLATAAGEGASLGFADEVIAGLGSTHPTRLLHGESPFDPNEYRSIRDRIRGVDKQYGEEHPVAHLAGELAGGLATGGAFGAARRSVARLAAEGAGIGAGAGAGNAEGDLADRARAAATGGVVGGALGTAAPILGRLAGEAGTRLLDATGMRPATKATAGRLARLAGIDSMDERAAVKVRDALESAGITPDDALAAAQAADKPVTLADVGTARGGTGVQRVARGAQSIPSEGADRMTDFFTARGQGQLDRMGGDLEEMLGAKRENVFQTAEDLIDQRRANAKPLYDKAYGAADAQNMVDDPEVLSLFKSPHFRKAWEIAQDLGREQGYHFSPLTKTSNVGGETVEELLPQPVRVLDSVKQGLDAYLERGFKGGSMDKKLAYTLKQKLSDMLKRVDELHPDYGKARQQFAGDSGLMDALERGRTEFLKQDPREIAMHLADMTAGEKELYRRGAFDALMNHLEGTGDTRDLTKAALGNPRMRERLSALSENPQAFEKWAQKFGTERSMRETENFVMRGAQTARIQAEQSDLGHIPGEAIAQAAHGNIAGALRAFLTTQFRRAQGYTPEMVDALEPYITSTGNDLEHAIARLKQPPPPSSLSFDGLRRAAENVAGGGAGEVAAPHHVADADSPNEDPVLKEVQRVGASMPSRIRRRPDESSRAFRARRERLYQTMHLDLSILLNSADYKGFSDAVKAGHLSAAEAEHRRRALIEQSLRETRRQFASR